MQFQKYFEDIVNSYPLYVPKTQTSDVFKGISRAEFPEWKGWKIVNKYIIKNNITKEIDNEELELLVRIHYYVKYIKEMY